MLKLDCISMNILTNVSKMQNKVLELTSFRENELRPVCKYLLARRLTSSFNMLVVDAVVEDNMTPHHHCKIGGGGVSRG